MDPPKDLIFYRILFERYFALQTDRSYDIYTLGWLFEFVPEVTATEGGGRTLRRRFPREDVLSFHRK